MRIAIVGAGIAGALLAWRLCEGGRRDISVDVYSGPSADATAASGGLVRGFEPDPAACRSAAISLAELRGSRLLRGWSGYREIGSVYLLDTGHQPERSAAIVAGWIPSSIRLEPGDRTPFRGMPAGTVAVVEERAGYVSPHRFRASALAVLPAARARVITTPVVRVTPRPAVHLADRVSRRYDVVVVAAGAWTPALLQASGLPTAGMRSKQIQYTMCTGSVAGLGSFVDDTTGLYGRPGPCETLLLGLPGDRWDLSADAAAEPDEQLAERLAAVAYHRLGIRLSDLPITGSVAMTDCYVDPPGLSLRATLPGCQVLTFTGGSGGAAKSALAASRTAAATLLADHAVGC